MRATGWEAILEEGEAIVWQGAPDPRPDWGAMLTPDAGLALVTVPLTGGLALWGPDALLRGAGAVLAAGGLVLAARPMVADVWQRRSTFYSLSTRAAYVGTAPRGRRRLARYPLDQMGPFRLEPGSPGTVWFGRDAATGAPLGFRGIAEAARVHDLLRDLVEAAAPGAAAVACQPGPPRATTAAPPDRNRE